MYNLYKFAACLTAFFIFAVSFTACGSKNTANEQPKPETEPEVTQIPNEEPEPENVWENVRVENVSYNGKCSGNIYWEFGDDGLLVIYGNGDTPDYGYSADNAAPWSGLEIKRVFVHDTVTSLGNCAFYNMSTITEAGIPTSIKKCGYDTFSGTQWLANQTEQFVVIGDGVLIKYKGASSEVTIPYGVKYISNAFVKENELSVDIRSVKMPDSVVEIGSYAFYACRFLRSVKFSNAVKVIDDGAFESSGLQNEIEIPSSVETIGRNSFADCAELYGIKLSSQLKKIGDNAFSYSNISYVSIPAAVEQIGYNPFEGCGVLNRIDVNTDNRFFANDDNGIIYSKDMSELISCPNALNIKEVILPQTVTRIRSGAFSKCLYINSVVFTGDVQSIGKNAFEQSIVISSKANSYVQNFALKNGIAFRQI